MVREVGCVLTRIAAKSVCSLYSVLNSSTSLRGRRYCCTRLSSARFERLSFSGGCCTRVISANSVSLHHTVGPTMLWEHQ